MKPFKPVFIALSILVSSFILYQSLSTKPPGRICFNQSCVMVETPHGREEMSRGLMYRESLAEGNGMLFVFEKEGFHRFWMKNMKFPIDMIWMDSGGQVVHIDRSVPPCRKEPCMIYQPDEKAMYVLEVVGNYTLRENIREGSSASLILP